MSGDCKNVHAFLEMVFLNVQLEKCLPFPIDFRRRMHFLVSFLFLDCCFSFTICPTVTFLGWKCYRIFPSDLICLIFKHLLKWFKQSLARDYSPTHVTWWICGTCLLLFHHVLQTLSYESGITGGKYGLH